MKAMYSFLMFFYILEQCYEQFQGGEFSAFLSSISPELWEDGMPMNMTVYYDWENRNDTKSLDDSNIMSTVYSFLDFYEKQMSYDFSKVKVLLKNMPEAETVKKAKDKADFMFQKHPYNE